jgi:hypothetical protein
MRLRRCGTSEYLHEDTGTRIVKYQGIWRIAFADNREPLYTNTLEQARTVIAALYDLDNPYQREHYATANATDDRSSLLAASEEADCTVRAFAVWAGVSYAEAHAIMREAGRKDRCGLAHDALGTLLRQYGKPCRIGVKNVTLSQFVQRHPKGRYYVAVYGHALAVIDGIVHDWHPGNRRIVIAAWEF